MNQQRRRTLKLTASLAAASSLPMMPLAAKAAEESPLTIVVPYPPGGSTDNSARILQKAIAPKLGRPVIVENRPGAAGNIGAAYVASSPPDSARILLATQPVITLNPHLYDLSFDPLKDLTPVVNGYSGVVGIAAHPSLPVNTVAELIDYAKANPGVLNYGTSGAGSGQHVMMVLLADRTGIDIVHVPYRGGGPMTNDLVAGHIQLGVGTLSALKPHLDAGAVKILAITEPERFAEVPDIPTVSETVPGVTLVPWMGYLGPAGMPQDQVQKISQAILEALEIDAVREPLLNMGLVVIGDGPEAFAQSIASEYAEYGRVIRDNNISLD